MQSYHVSFIFFQNCEIHGLWVCSSDPSAMPIWPNTENESYIRLAFSETKALL